MNCDTLTIVQLNANRQPRVMTQLMMAEEARKADILAIQEGNRSRDGRGYNPSGGVFTLIDSNAAKTRASIYINKRIRTEDFEVLVCTDDLVTIKLWVELEGGRKPIRIHSAYNPPSPLGSAQIPIQLQQICGALRHDESQVLAGDINLHHHKWGSKTEREHQIADYLLETTQEQGLALLNAQGEVIRRRQRVDRLKESILDLAFASTDLVKRLISCKVRADLSFESDHLALKTVIGLDGLLQREAPPTRAWKRIDGERFQKDL